MLDQTRNIRSRLEDQLLRAVLILDPRHCRACSAARVLLDTLLRAPAAQHLPALVDLGAVVAIQRVVAQAAEDAWAVDLGRKIFHAGRGRGGAAVDRCFLAAADVVQYVRDQLPLVEMRQRRQNPQPVALARQERRVELRLGAFRLGFVLPQPALDIRAVLVTGFSGSDRAWGRARLPSRLAPAFFLPFVVDANCRAHKATPAEGAAGAAVFSSSGSISPAQSRRISSDVSSSSSSVPRASIRPSLSTMI